MNGPSTKAKAAVIIPALNEEKSLPLVLQELPQEDVQEVIVVDNGSEDGTAGVAREAGVTLVEERRRGYGSACLAGIRALKGRMPEIVVFLDADYSDSPVELPRLLEPIQKGQADFVLGSRTLGGAEPGALLPQARWGNALATFLIRLLYSHRFTDMGPFRAIRSEALERLGMVDRNYGWNMEMQVKAIEAKLRILEVPVSYKKRVGVSKITGTLRGTIGAGYKILWTLFKLRFLGGSARSRKPANSAEGQAGQRNRV